MDEIVEEAKLRPVTHKYLAQRLREYVETYANQMARNAAASRRWIVTPERVRSEVDADLASGWAYKLLSTFRRQTPFAFDEACPGCDWLARQEIDAASIERVAASHRLLIEDAHQPCYEDAYRDRLIHDGRVRCRPTSSGSWRRTTRHGHRHCSTSPADTPWTWRPRTLQTRSWTRSQQSTPRRTTGNGRPPH